MLTKAQIKLINSLKHKKNRQKHQLFVAEGVKVIKEILKSRLVVEAIYSTTQQFLVPDNQFFQVTEKELSRISKLKTSQTALALIQIPEVKINTVLNQGLVVALDGVRDPGNLGTIIRLCDWFGVSQLVCSKDTVDCYNPKVIQATMGSIARLNISYEDLPNFIQQTNLPVYGAFMSGKVVYSTNLPTEGVLVMGNEANGISNEVSALIQHQVSIPQFGEQNVESLNVATATSILLSEFKRGSFIER